jgi:hypothetical protein
MAGFAMVDRGEYAVCVRNSGGQPNDLHHLAQNL